MQIELAGIVIPDNRKRRVNESTVVELVKSFQEIGQLQPIMLTEDNRLISGRHRLDAATRLGWTFIEAHVTPLTDLQAELAEIDENLVRNDGTELERANELKRRKEIYEALHPETKQGAKGGWHNNKTEKLESETISFSSDTAAKTGKSERSIQQSAQIANNIPDDVQKSIEATPVADNKTDLLALARMKGDQQRAVADVLAAGTATNVREAVREVKKQKFEEAHPLPTDKYRVIYADPPWQYGNSMPDYFGEQADHYPLMTVAEICKMPVVDMVEDNAVLFLWVTSPILEESFEVVQAWGFKYKATFIWDKVGHVMGHYNSVRHEILLVCVRGSCQPDVQRLFDSVVTEERTEHSKKPETFRAIIDTIYPYGKRIELFARTQAKNWNNYGNEGLASEEAA